MGPPLSSLSLDVAGGGLGEKKAVGLRGRHAVVGRGRDGERGRWERQRPQETQTIPKFLEITLGREQLFRVAK